MIKLFDPNVGDEEIAAAKDVLLSHNWASGAGVNKVGEFEEKFRNYLACDEVVALNSGTAALHLAISLANAEGKSVFVPSLTFVSTAHAALYSGANPVFVDVDPKTLCMSPSDLEKKAKVVEGAAIVPVHFGGMSCSMNELAEISSKHGLILIDDAAHACGAIYANKKVGSFEEMTCFSFHPVKNLSMPTGGAISINGKNSGELKKRLNSMRWCGIDNRQKHSYDVTSISPNYYMNEISAAIGLIQLGKLDRMNARRKEIAKRYSNEIKTERRMPYSEDCVYHLYWIISNDREKLIEYLNAKGIEVGTHYSPVHSFSAYKDRFPADVPVTNGIADKIVTLPIHTNLKDEEVTYIIDSINSFGS